MRKFIFRFDQYAEEVEFEDDITEEEIEEEYQEWVLNWISDRTEWSEIK